jgi:hypothetical protein
MTSYLISVSDAVLKLVSERQPLFLDQHTETLQRAIVRVQTQLRQRAQLRGAIPSIRAYIEKKQLINKATATKRYKEQAYSETK